MAATDDGNVWHGYDKQEFKVDGRDCYIVLPKIPAPGKPWIWRARFPSYHSEIDVALLAKGFHVAYMDVAGLFGRPKAVEHWNRFYEHVTSEFGFAPKMTLEGVSRGGLIVYNRAKRNPRKVNSIYCDSPVSDIKSWPGGKGRGLGSPDAWATALGAYGMSEAEMLAFGDNPIDNLEALAAVKAPVLHVVCDRDRVVPPSENTDLFQERYRRLGGPMEVFRNERQPETLNGHHFPLERPGAIVDFILKHTPGVKEQAGAGFTPHGHQYYKIRSGLRNSQIRFEQGGKARVAFLGGSITKMTGWRDLVCADLKKRYPKTEIECIDAGIPSTGSTPGAFRLDRDVLRHGPIDLLFEEAAVNDSTNFRTPAAILRGMEGIIRHMRESSPKTDIVMLHFVDPDKMETIRGGKTPEVIAIHERVAEHYAVPSINLAREITERIDAGEFTWEQDFKNLHPSPFGQTVYQRSIARRLEAAWWEPAAEQAAMEAHPLPAPIDPKSYCRGRLVDLREAQVIEGFKLDPAWRPSDDARTRPGFVDVPVLVAEQPGASLRFRFTGTAVGIFVAAGPDAGIVEYSIDGRPFQSQDLFTRWSKGLHIPWAHVLDGTLADAGHELVLRVTNEKNEDSQGHAVRIVHLLVNGASEGTDSAKRAIQDQP